MAKAPKSPTHKIKRRRGSDHSKVKDRKVRLRSGRIRLQSRKNTETAHLRQRVVVMAQDKPHSGAMTCSNERE